MPFKSEKQRRFLWKNEPKIAKRWVHKYGSKTTSSEIKKAAESRLKKKDTPVGKN